MRPFELGGKPRQAALPLLIGVAKMKKLRATVVLEMAFSLHDKGSFTEQEIRDETEASRSTFFRCLSDLRCYLQEHRPYAEIVFDSQNGVYKMTKID